MSVAQAAGRPRSEENTRAILDAALELVSTEGYAAVSVERIAQRAGVQKPAVYRRWANKAELVADAVLTIAAPLADPDTGTIVGDLTALLNDVAATSRTPAGRAGICIMAEQGTHPDLVEALRTGMMTRRREIFAVALQRGIKRGEIRKGIDLDVAVEMLLGPVILRLLIRREEVPAGIPAATVKLLLRGLQP
jgi:AcrR family transcriptional regulator